MVSRLERTALGFCLLASAVAVGVQRGRVDVALGILGGGALIGASYWAIKRGVDGLVGLLDQGPGGSRGSEARSPDDAGGRDQGPGARDQGPEARSQGSGARGPAIWAPILLRFAGRYALLGLIAYVMIARFRLHPIGLVIGVSSVLVAASIEAIRSLSRPAGARRGSPDTPR
jgi:hypothetical protein